MKVTAEEKAACLISVFAKQCNAQSPTSRSCSLSTNTTTGNFSFSRIEYPSFTKKLSTLNVWKACGNDGIPNRVLKECAATLAGPLTHIFNCSLQSGQFPAQWKRGEIKPLYKHKGTRSDPSCYRPVVLLPCVSKVFESLVKDQLQAHCLNIHAIPDEQFGFLPHRSTVWQLLSVVDDWDRALDSGSAVHACFIDMAKAFDRVDHALLSHVLSTLGVSGIELCWFESYLHERSVCTVVEQHKSPFARISNIRCAPRISSWPSTLHRLLPEITQRCIFELRHVGWRHPHVRSLLRRQRRITLLSSWEWCSSSGHMGEWMVHHL